MRASGLSGELRYGYQVAGRLGPWAIESEGPAFRFQASLVEADAVWMASPALDLVLALGRTEWIWRGVQPVVTGAQVAIVLTRRPDAVASLQA